MLGENGTLVPVGEQVLSMGNDYGKYYEEPGIEILLCKGENPYSPWFSGARTGKKPRLEKGKGLSILRGPLRSCAL